MLDPETRSTSTPLKTASKSRLKQMDSRSITGGFSLMSQVILHTYSYLSREAISFDYHPRSGRYYFHRCVSFCPRGRGECRSLSQRPPGQTTPEQPPPRTETPRHRPPGQRPPLNRDPPPGQRPT